MRAQLWRIVACLVCEATSCRYLWRCEGDRDGEDVSTIATAIAARHRSAHGASGLPTDLDAAAAFGAIPCAGRARALAEVCGGGDEIVRGTTVGPGHDRFAAFAPISAPADLPEQAAPSPRRVRVRRRLRNATRLKAAELVVMMMSTAKGGGAGGKGTDYWGSRAVAAKRTWAADFHNLIYVLEGSPATEALLRGCDGDRDGVRRCASGPSALVVDGCDGSYYGASGPCCKFDAAASWMLSAAGRARFPAMKWWMFADDDNYVVLSNLYQYLGRLDATLPQFRSPLRLRQTPGLQTGMWGYPECAGTIASRLAQPLVLARAALEKIAPAVRSNGTARVCAAWDLTHDYGCAVLFWQAGLTWGPLTGFGLSGKKDYEPNAFKPRPQIKSLADTMIVHSIKTHKDKMDFDAIHAVLATHVAADRVPDWPTADDGWGDWEAPIGAGMAAFSRTRFSKTFDASKTFEVFPPAECCEKATDDPKGHCPAGARKAGSVEGRPRPGHPPGRQPPSKLHPSLDKKRQDPAGLEKRLDQATVLANLREAGFQTTRLAKFRSPPPGPGASPNPPPAP